MISPLSDSLITRNKTSLKLVPALALSAAALFLLSPQAKAQIALGNIWCLGDSITAGSTGNGGYLPQLYSDLTAANYSFSYVGTQTDTNPSDFYPYNGRPDTSQYDTYEGHPGYTIQQMPPDTSTGGILDNVGSWLSTVSQTQGTPNYILLLIGTNDMLDDYDPATAYLRLENLINTISNPTTGLDPGANLIVGTIPPDTAYASEPAYETTLNAEISAYNSEIPGVVSALDAEGEKVTMVDLSSAYVNSSGEFLTNDGVHPNNNAYAPMGDKWAAAIEAVAAPEPSSLALLGVGAGLLSLLSLRRRTILLS